MLNYTKKSLACATDIKQRRKNPFFASAGLTGAFPLPAVYGDI